MSSKLDNRLELLRSTVMDTGGVEEKVEGMFASCLIPTLDVHSSLAQ